MRGVVGRQGGASGTTGLRGWRLRPAGKCKRTPGKPQAFLAVAAAVVLVLLGAGCHSAASAPYAFPEESAVMVLAPQADKTLRVVDRAAFDPGAAAHAVIDATPTGGLARTLASMQGAPTYATASFLSGPLGQALYLDLDQPVAGQLFISNSLSPATRAPDSVRIITELFVDGRFAGGSINEHTVYTTSQAWNPVPVYFRPEASVLPAGSTVEIRVSAQTGLADLRLGTGGAHASRVELAFYPFDPLSGAVFLEQGKLVSALSDDNTTGSEALELALAYMQAPEFDNLPAGVYVVRGGTLHEPPDVHGLHPALVLPLPLLLLGLAGRMPPRRAMGILVAAAIVISGCAGKASVDDVETDPEAPKPRVDASFEDAGEQEAEKQVAAQVGTVRGVVTNYFGLPVEAAHISILATNKFSASDPAGAFEIKDVPVGKYTMRVDAEGLQSLEQGIEVQVAKVTKLSVVLVPPEGTRPDQIQHLHDEWRGASTRLLDEVTISPSFYLYTQQVDGVGGMCAHAYHSEASHGTNNAATQCTVPIPFDFTKRVLPGTALVEFVLDWDDSAGNIPALGIAYSNGLRGTSNLNMHLPRGPGEPFLMHVFPNQADPGHQEFSNWQFHIFAPGNDAFGQRDAPYEMPPITAKASIHKGIIPFEPKHEDRWGDKTRFTLADGTQRMAFSCLCTPESSTSFYREEDGWISYTSSVWTPLKGTWVPPGTQAIEGRLIKSGYAPAAGGPTLPDPPHIEYSLGYKPANVPPGQAHGNLRIVEDITPTSGGFAFTIHPQDDDLDSWYQSSSQWRFYLLARSSSFTYYGSHGFMLEAHAIKDPSWSFED